MVQAYSGKPQYSEMNLPHCHFIHGNTDMYWPGMEGGPPR